MSRSCGHCKAIEDILGGLHHSQNCPAVPAHEKSPNLYGLIADTTFVHPAPFNEDVERVKFRDWYRNDHGSPAEHVPGVWASRTTTIAWNAWLARAKQ